MRDSRNRGLKLGHEYFVVVCPYCGQAKPLWEHKGVGLSGSTAKRSRCVSNGCRKSFTYEYRQVRVGQFDGKNIELLPLRNTEFFRNDIGAVFHRLTQLRGLYKYVTADRIDILKNKLIRFTPPIECNDVSEFMPAFDSNVAEALVKALFTKKIHRALKDALKASNTPGEVLMANSEEKLEEELQKKSQVNGSSLVLLGPMSTWQDLGVTLHKQANNGTIPNHLVKLVAEYRSTLGILSLSEDPVNPVMWAHYAGNNTGIVIEFIPPCLVRHGVIEMWSLGSAWPVIYSTKRQYNFEQLDHAAFTHEKGAEWSYEKEWRVVRPLGECSRTIGNIQLFAVDPKSISGVILGCRADSALKKEVFSLCKEDAQLQHLNISQVIAEPGGRFRLRTLRKGQQMRMIAFFCPVDISERSNSNRDIE